jgi:hypothetical protein
MARALFQSWFVDFEPVRVKAEGRDLGLPKAFADLFPDRLVGSEIGEIPEGWQVATLGDIAEHPRRGVRPAGIEPRILRKYGYPPDKQEKATKTVLEQAELLSAGWTGS